MNYSTAVELHKNVQVGTLLTVIGEDAREVYLTFTGWTADGNDSKIKLVLNKFAECSHPHKNIP